MLDKINELYLIAVIMNKRGMQRIGGISEREKVYRIKPKDLKKHVNCILNVVVYAI